MNQNDMHYESGFGLIPRSSMYTTSEFRLSLCRVCHKAQHAFLSMRCVMWFGAVA